jgi:hypothetical protein
MRKWIRHGEETDGRHRREVTSGVLAHITTIHILVRVPPGPFGIRWMRHDSRESYIGEILLQMGGGDWLLTRVTGTFQHFVQMGVTSGDSEIRRRRRKMPFQSFVPLEHCLNDDSLSIVHTVYVLTSCYCFAVVCSCLR